MRRRTFLAIGLVALGLLPWSVAQAKNKRFIFRIKTKSGGIIDGVTIQASDVEAAKVKLWKRYPGCQILSVKEGRA